MKFLFASLVVFCLHRPANAELAIDLFSGRIQGRGISAPLWVEPERSLSMIVRVERLYTDYQRKGFFRLGILPIGVMEGITFELRDPELAATSFAQLHERVGPQAAKRLEFRRVNFLIFGEHTNRLESGRARIAPDGRWELIDGVRLSSGTNQVEASRATLQTFGGKAGELIMATVPPRTNNFFIHLESPTTNQKKTQ